MFYYDHYVIDWDKVDSIEDIKRLLASMSIAFEPSYPGLESIKDLVRLERVRACLTSPTLPTI